jgi:hypothetical protein
MFSDLPLWIYVSQKANDVQKGKIEIDVLNLSDKMKNWDVLKGGKSLLDVW